MFTVQYLRDIRPISDGSRRQIHGRARENYRRPSHGDSHRGHENGHPELHIEHLMSPDEQYRVSAFRHLIRG
jgi:hypothetical protein